MGRDEVNELYRILMSNEFDFIERGIHDLQAIYSAVRQRYSHLCDDDYLCLEHCSSGANQPEWKHKVRWALEKLKKRPNAGVSKASGHGSWLFS